MEKSLLMAGRATVTDELRKGVIKEDMQAASSTALLSFMAMLLWAAYIHKAIPALWVQRQKGPVANYVGDALLRTPLVSLL
jgi:hypothetical protein